jgi:hypothetical protein
MRARSNLIGIEFVELLGRNDGRLVHIQQDALRSDCLGVWNSWRLIRLGRRRDLKNEAARQAAKLVDVWALNRSTWDFTDPFRFLLGTKGTHNSWGACAVLTPRLALS